MIVIPQFFNAASLDGSNEPIRDALLSLERLEQRANELADELVLSKNPRIGRGISKRLAENAGVLLLSYKAMVAAINAGRPITPAAEWLVDNYHVVDEHLRQISQDLSPGFYKRLPKLANGHLQFLPRVFGLAWTFVAHTDSHFEADALRRFVLAFQKTQVLEIGELWALPITMRIVLIENLRRISERVLEARQAREAADDFADDLLGVNGREKVPLEAMKRRLERQHLIRAFVVQLTQRMREREELAFQVMSLLELRLNAQGSSSEQAVAEEYLLQTSANVTVRNIITSMRLLSLVDWAVFFESVSAVDVVLTQNAGFAPSDFATRDRYRHAIEELARSSVHSEVQIAGFAVALAATAADNKAADLRTADVGYYLISNGRAILERQVGFKVGVFKWFWRGFRAGALWSYLSGIALLGIIIVALGDLALARQIGWLEQVVLLALLAIPALDFAVAMVNHSVTKTFLPRTLAKLELKDGIPSAFRTMVVIPTLLTSKDAILEEFERLEVRYLANSSGELLFAVLGDFTDAPQATMPLDAQLLATADAAVQQLNQRYGATLDGTARFFFFHRQRIASNSEQTFMGWERKRGKLHEFNRLLRGAKDTSFVLNQAGLLELPQDVRLIITLDADTQLPRGAAQRLVGAMAHPLNRPRFDPSNRVVEGYAVLQPRITLSLPSERQATVFQQVFSSHAGMDPYASAVSDVYQDLFHEGSYAGKGIYDLDAFERALEQRIPDETLLSHDLFEGLFARAGLLSDVELVEEYPSHYGVRSARQHRWVRGDWQLLPWIFSTRAPISLIGRWKMLDNLRRSLTPVAVVLALLLGWLWLPAAPVWTGFVALIVLLPMLLPFFTALFSFRAKISWRSYGLALLEQMTLGLAQFALTITFLADQSATMLDAIFRTLGRLFVTKQRLLEWRTAAQAQAGSNFELLGFYQQMLAAPVLAGLAMGLVLLVQPASLILVVSFGLLWGFSPMVARWASLHRPRQHLEVMQHDQQTTLRLMARRTWRFFERFVGAKDHFLPPDNFQEIPQPLIAHRTSPTNIGLALLSTVAAHDFAWIGRLETIERCEQAFDAIEQLPTHRGHLLNWYDTQTLQPLEPRYVSTVDSGNMAGHLLAFKAACLGWIHQARFGATTLLGPLDALHLARVAMQALPSSKTNHLEPLHTALETLEQALSATLPTTSETWQMRFAQLLALTEGALAATTSQDATDNQELMYWIHAIRASLQSHQRDVSADLEPRLEQLAARAEHLFVNMEFGFLFDTHKKLFSIGFDLATQRCDPSFYDLLASEARLTSFIAIAKNEVPTAHWFHLGRELTPIGRGTALISWTGSMFEYLMPRLMMRSPPGSLLAETSHLVVQAQIAYAKSRSTPLQQIPWGISESAFAARDLSLDYQYLAFGVPGLGLKRGLSDDLVIAPYATALAAMIDPVAATKNLVRLEQMGGSGRYGFYDALDFTPLRIPDNLAIAKRFVVVQNYMAHHQGMSLLAFANVLLNDNMTARFHSDPRVQSAELLLQERTPRSALVARPRAEEVLAARQPLDTSPNERRFNGLHEAARQTHLLSNGRYSVMLSGVGSGYSHLQDLAITRWTQDSTLDNQGSYIYVRVLPTERTEQIWSVTPQPLGVEANELVVKFFEDRAEFTRRDGVFSTKLEVLVSPEDDAEMRRVTITNHGQHSRDLELTSYAEIVLTAPIADQAHPAFAKLFVQTEFEPNLGILLATRRPRSPEEPVYWAAHTAILESIRLESAHFEPQSDLEFETDRAQFIGRNQNLKKPVAILAGQPLSGTVGAVLDPIFSLRRKFQLPAGATARVSFATVVAPNRQAVLELADRYNDPDAFERGLTLAWTHAQVQLHHLGISPDEAHIFQKLATQILYQSPEMRASSAVLARNSLGQSGLWRHGISGDLPILLLRMSELSDLEIVRQLLRAHEYWHSKCLAVDVVILNQQPTSYMQELQEAIERLLRSTSPKSNTRNSRGHVFTLRADLLSDAEQILLQSTARVLLLGTQGTLSEQVIRNCLVRPMMPSKASALQGNQQLLSNPNRPDLEFFNGLGGFGNDGLEYQIILAAQQFTPAPWINVIANEKIGFTVSESGSGYTWAENSRENKLTPWSNDPVTDPINEIIYIRDEETLALFTATPMPIRETSPYTICHGQGYSHFSHATQGLQLELSQFVATDDPVKISRLSIENCSSRPRKLSITTYLEWVLGAQQTGHILTEQDSLTKAIFARNHWSEENSQKIAFTDLIVQWQRGHDTAFTCDRLEFIGQYGSLESPAALQNKTKLSGKIGAGLDPCTAMQSSFELATGEKIEVVLLLGQCQVVAEAQSLIGFYRNVDMHQIFEQVKQHWQQSLTSIQVQTPNRALDIMLNRWLPYQTLSSRILARTGFYQAGGAYGFRDQLQDTMAMASIKPELARKQIVLAASRQFLEGDVQHWWHPPLGRGVRTRICDDLIWLPYAISHHLEISGDDALLDEQIAFLEGAILLPDQEDAYFTPSVSAFSATLFEHGARALDKSLAVGFHGLPLIGSGDWNDGMNRVGKHGQGESVWLGWFLYTNLIAWAKLATARQELERAQIWHNHALALQHALETHGWDGQWYKRAFFDDGTPLGSCQNDECQIDSISQTWAVISGAAEATRAAQAMNSLEQHLIKRAEQIILLFTPPFENTSLDPGYIKGYVPGVRENGGQYTHAAVWSVVAFAMLGDGGKATALFDLLNPVLHSQTRAKAERYKVEPYVVAADVYAQSPHIGRGGWTWYTGSSGWLYRAGLESILGFKLRGGQLEINPCIPTDWTNHQIVFKYHSSTYTIHIENPDRVSTGVKLIEIDGIGHSSINLSKDGLNHFVRVVMGLVA
jgi:cyclic beta-1,2-glucan synthetase